MNIADPVQTPALKIAVVINRTFLSSSAAMLLAFGIAVIMSNQIESSWISAQDPIFEISMRTTLWICGVSTLLAALTCLFGRCQELSAYLLLWLSANFLVYCLCLGLLNMSLQGYLKDFAHAFGISSFAMYNALKIACFYLLVGSSSSLLWMRLDKKRIARLKDNEIIADFVKMTCPSCETHISFASSSLGQNIPCPHCRAEITLEKPGYLKMTCVLCKGKIEFPMHSVGRKIPCPHCGKRITLLRPIQTDVG